MIKVYENSPKNIQMVNIYMKISQTHQELGKYKFTQQLDILFSSTKLAKSITLILSNSGKTIKISHVHINWHRPIGRQSDRTNPCFKCTMTQKSPDAFSKKLLASTHKGATRKFFQHCFSIFQLYKKSFPYGLCTLFLSIFKYMSL